MSYAISMCLLSLTNGHTIHTDETFPMLHVSVRYSGVCDIPWQQLLFNRKFLTEMT